MALEPADLLDAEKGGLASALLAQSLQSLPLKKFFQQIAADMIEEADVASVDNPQSCFDCVKLFFKSFRDLADSRCETSN